MRKAIVITPMVSLLIILISCNIEFTGEVYIQDLIDVASNPNEVLYTIAKFAFESPGSDNQQQLIDFMKTNFREAKNFHTESKGMNTFIVSDIKVPLLSLAQISKLKGDDLLAIVVSPEKESILQFGLYMDNQKFTKIQDYVKEEYWQTLSVSDFSISLRINNDIRTNAKLVLANVYADQKPILFTQDFMLSRRDTITIRFSDVLRDYIHENGYALFGEILL